MQRKIKVKQRRRQHYAAPIGGAFVLLALLGVIAVVVVSIRLTMQVLDNSNEKARLEDFIRPIVMYNPAPFESAADIPPENLLLYSMWTALTNEKAQNYVYSDTQELIVPASDLNVAANSLFSDVVTLEHQTFGDLITRYTYDEAAGVYYVPTHAELYVYSPEVQTIEKEDGLYKLTVGYLPPGNAWTTDFAGNRQNPSAEKIMYYYLSKDKSGYHVVKVQDLPSDVFASSEPEPQPEPQAE